MKKWVVLLITFNWIGSVNVDAQMQPVGYGTAIENNDGKPFPAPDSLAHLITRRCKTNTEKVNAICGWITTHIDYNIKQRPVGRSEHSSNFFNSYEEDDAAPLKPLDERIAINVLHKKVAFCDGFARLFKTLCDYSGIPAKIITGYANGGYSPRRNFISNHKWNVVYTDSAWHLIDVTWASGYVTLSNDFVRQYNDRYVFASPADFARDHHPEDTRWSMMRDPTMMDEFYYAPFKTFGFTKYHVVGFTPLKGFVEAAPGDTLSFAVELENSTRSGVLQACDTMPPEDTTSTEDLPELPKPGTSKMSCTYIVPDTGSKWINIVYRNEVVLRYRLKNTVRKIGFR